MAIEPHPLRRILETVGPDSCPNRLNFHCHTQCSDGSLEPTDLLNQACERGLEHFAITDHHTVRAFDECLNQIEQRHEHQLPSPKLWSGMEISCLLKGCLVHVLALGFESGHRSLQLYSQGDAVSGSALQAAEVCKAIHDAGGLAILAHPARYRIGYKELIETAAELGFDGGEAWYDYNMQSKWKPTPFICEVIDLQLTNLGLLRTCGTDSHGNDLGGR